MKPSLFSRPAWTGILACTTILALLPVLNLAFEPGLSLLSMQHEVQYSRLYRS